jgi:hypothetical protein
MERGVMMNNKPTKQMFFRLVINFLMVSCFVSTFFAPPLWAQSYEAQYGEELKSVPYVVRVRYAKESGQPWSEATYDQRLNYLDALSREEMALEMRTEQIANNKITAEMQKTSAREYVKNAEEQKEINRELAKVNRKIAADQKKDQLMLKSLHQKQKLQQLRDRDR